MMRLLIGVREILDRRLGSGRCGMRIFAQKNQVQYLPRYQDNFSKLPSLCGIYYLNKCNVKNGDLNNTIFYHRRNG